MIHTALLSYPLYDNHELFTAFKKLKSTIYDYDKKRYYNKALSEYGIYLRTYSPDGLPYSIYLLCTFDLKRIVNSDGKKTVDVFSSSELDILTHNFDYHMKSLLSELPGLSDWNCNRIDYAVNIETPYIREYLLLMRKGDFGKYKLNEESKKDGGSIYLESTAKHGSIRMNIYSKEDEIASKIDSYKIGNIDEYLSESKNILRVEIQCLNPKTSYLKRKYKMDKKNLQNFVDLDKAYYEFRYYLNKLAGSAPYHKKSVILEMIENPNNKISLPVRNRMKRFVEDLSKQHSSIKKVKNKYIEKNIMTKNELTNVTRRFKELGINPVPIPKNSGGYKGINKDKGLPSLLSLVEQKLRLETMNDSDEFLAIGNDYFR